MDYAGYLLKFEKMQRWINDDLTRSSVFAQANFLVAMGVFNYIEILGSFYENDEKRGVSTRRFNYVFKNLFPDSYMQLFKSLQSLTGRDAYDCLRCGMTHEYLIKTYSTKGTYTKIKFTVVGVKDHRSFDAVVASAPCGLQLQQIGNDYFLMIYNARLIFDLDLAFEEYKKRLSMNLANYREKFVSRAQAIHLEELV